MKGFNSGSDTLDGTKPFGIVGNEKMAWSDKFDISQYNQFLIESGDCSYQNESRTQILHGEKAERGLRFLRNDYWNDQYIWDADELSMKGGAYIYMRQKFQRGGEVDARAIPGALKETHDPYAVKIQGKNLTADKLKTLSEEKKVSEADK